MELSEVVVWKIRVCSMLLVVMLFLGWWLRKEYLHVKKLFLEDKAKYLAKKDELDDWDYTSDYKFVWQREPGSKFDKLTKQQKIEYIISVVDKMSNYAMIDEIEAMYRYFFSLDILCDLKKNAEDPEYSPQIKNILQSLMILGAKREDERVLAKKKALKKRLFLIASKL